MKPKIDLLVPVYNGRKHLDVLLANLRTVEDFFENVIFYDDASEDNSAEILETRGFQVIRGTQNHGAGFARNELFTASSSEFIHFHDVDDPLCRSFFEAMVPELSPAHICIGQFVVEDAGRQVDCATAPSLASGRLPLAEAFAYFIHLNSIIFPREAIAQVGGFQPALRLHEDRFLMLCLAYIRFPWRLCPEARAIRLAHPGSTTSLAGAEAFRSNFHEFYELIFQRIPADELGFLLTDLLHNSQCLLANGRADDARRGFALCEQAGAKNFLYVSAGERLLFRHLGFYRTSSIKGWLRRKMPPALTRK